MNDAPHLLVGLVGALWVSDLGLEVAGLVLNVVADTREVRELGISVDVHLYNAILDSGLDLLLGRSRRGRAAFSSRRDCP